ncbi:hypothetical protein AAFF_G00361550 [Aldrovandia affinis]|uniref:Uncharacterized protein n=1 Tax=Aldrovandia affinis TaxID=143900 RepID=A0AAD7SHU5_9TELE|nr:hypothetical protein AAFF_G00361550 [Aldrovandia affinis]
MFLRYPLPCLFRLPPSSTIIIAYPLCLPAHGPASVLLCYPLPCRFRLPPSSTLIAYPSACSRTSQPASLLVRCPACLLGLPSSIPYPSPCK